uniref:Leucine-rich repeat-containing N-terminal plant-type domain-containing protein n=1 Tax=Nelumbo nucifera TaxID=4432 RepID=A0A822Y7C9_NELNU|nr:TPA_asm: hypothetical protein HUJ06_031382 [Nelumbo nucifera]
MKSLCSNTRSVVSLFHLSLLLVSASLPSLTLSSSVRCNPHDKKVLLRIKKSINNPNALLPWDPEIDCCDWDYIVCNPQTYRVTQLAFFQAYIPGQIPSAIGDLPYLETLSFDEVTQLNGTIPYSITKLRNLKLFRLNWTPFSGPIPEFLGQLKNLDYLDLGYNQFSGPIPASLGDLPKLENLYLNRNNLTGKIPDSLGKLKSNLTWFDLSHNQLSGKIPKSLGEMNSKAIILSNNKLVGDASMVFKAKGTTEQIDLSLNQFDFDVSRVRFPKTLTYLDLSHNRIRGSIPKQVTELNLQFMNVSYNRLCGKIPVGGTLQQFSVDSFVHNKCLCGTPLPKCK